MTARRSTTEREELSSGADETVESIADLERRAEESISTGQRRIERATALAGRPRAIYALVWFVGLWIAVNAVLAHFGRAFDPPPFSYLSIIISFTALLMTIFILTTENRQSTHDIRRDQLDLQINLLNERKISKVIEMLDALRRDSPAVPNRNDPEVHELRQSADPHAIVRALDERTPDNGIPPP